MLHVVAILLSLAQPAAGMGFVSGPAAPGPRHDLVSLDRQKPSQRDALLKALSQQLKTAPDANSAGVLADAIRKLWQSSDSPTIALLMSRASILIKAKDYEIAVDILGAVSEIAPDYSEGWFRRADALLQMGEYGRALHDVGKVLEIEPEHFDALLRLGIILKKLGDDDGALNAFRKALTLYPQMPGLKRVVDELNLKVNGQAI